MIAESPLDMVRFRTIEVGGGDSRLESPKTSRGGRGVTDLKKIPKNTFFGRFRLRDKNIKSGKKSHSLFLLIFITIFLRVVSTT